LYLKGLFENFRHEAIKSQIGSKNSSHRAPRINDLETSIHVAPGKKNGIAAHHDYEPTRIQDTRDSLFWKWRRVTEWYRYISDPLENINGHIIT